MPQIYYQFYLWIIKFTEKRNIVNTVDCVSLEGASYQKKKLFINFYFKEIILENISKFLWKYIKNSAPNIQEQSKN